MEKEKNIKDDIFPAECPECPRGKLKKRFEGKLPENKCERCVVEETLEENLKKKLESDMTEEVMECPKCKAEIDIDCGGSQKLEQWKCKDCGQIFEIDYFVDPETGEEKMALGYPRYPLFPGLGKEQEKQG